MIHQYSHAYSACVQVLRICFSFCSPTISQHSHSPPPLRLSHFKPSSFPGMFFFLFFSIFIPPEVSSFLSFSFDGWIFQRSSSLAEHPCRSSKLQEFQLLTDLGSTLLDWLSASLNSTFSAEDWRPEHWLCRVWF